MKCLECNKTIKLPKNTQKSTKIVSGTMVEVQCEVCGIKFERLLSEVNRNKGKGSKICCSVNCAGKETKFCSNQCLKRHWDKNNRKRMQDEYSKFKTDQGCQICGYDKYGGSMDYHHIDPNKKKRRVAPDNYLTKKGKDEIAKCILVCKNCHYEIHGGVIKIDEYKDM